MPVLVTGSDGYVGAVLGPYLLARGWDAIFERIAMIAERFGFHAFTRMKQLRTGQLDADGSWTDRPA
jgi:hypothetical protein